MRIMSLTEVPPRPGSLDDCIALLRVRSVDEKVPRPQLSAEILGYMAWPSDSQGRESWIATVTARSNANQTSDTHISSFLEAVSRPALANIAQSIPAFEVEWIRAADVFQLVVDMSQDDRVARRGGASVVKASELLETYDFTPSHARFTTAWGHFRDVAHLVTAGAFLARESQSIKKPYSGSVFATAWLAPEALLTLAWGYQAFGFQFRPHSQTESILPTETLWRLPEQVRPPNAILPVRRLTHEQIEFIEHRRAKRK
jgi:hypothetical protein